MSEALEYWPVLVMREGSTEGYGFIAVTDGDYTPHTPESVRNVAEFDAGGPVKMYIIANHCESSRKARDFMAKATETHYGFTYCVDHMS